MSARALALLLALPVVRAAAQMPGGGPPGGGPPGGGPAAAEAPSAPAAGTASGLSAAQADRPRRPKKEKPFDVEESTDAAKGQGVDDIYGGAKLRDPFMKLAGAGVAAAPVAAAPKEFDPEEFSIHKLELKGIMRDKAGMTALLVDIDTRFTFMLRGGRLYDMRKKAVPNVTGSIQPAQKSVTLTTADKDVQTLRLGEDADEAEE